MLEGFYRFLFTLLKMVFKSFGTRDFFFFPFLAAFNIIANLCLGDCWSLFLTVANEGKKICNEEKKNVFELHTGPGKRC